MTHLTHEKLKVASVLSFLSNVVWRGVHQFGEIRSTTHGKLSAGCFPALSSRHSPHTSLSHQPCRLTPCLHTDSIPGSLWEEGTKELKEGSYAANDLQGRGESQNESSATWHQERLMSLGGKINLPITAWTLQFNHTGERERGFRHARFWHLQLPCTTAWEKHHANPSYGTAAEDVLTDRDIHLQLGARRHSAPLPSWDQDRV